ncbi:MAG: thioredoxin [Clostridiales bacterium]|nr:MAG: thioredoxin [Clostridiales bacterium]
MAELKITSQNYASEVEASALPVLLDFWAPWCGPCRMLAPVIEELAEELAGKVKVGKVNVDEEPELSSDFGIVSIPTLVVVKDGKVVQTATGVRPKNAILAMLG